MPNPTLIAFDEADNGSGSGTSQTSSTLTWQTGDIILLFAFTTGGNESFNTPTNTGSGLSWTQVQLHNGNGTSAQGAGGACWSAVASASSSGTVTANLSAADQLAIGVYQIRNPSGYTIAVGNSNVGFALSGTSESVAVTMSSADSMVCWGASDFQATQPLGSGSPTPTTHSSSSPGPTALPFSKNIANNIVSYYFDNLDDETSTGSISFGYTSLPFNAALTIIAVEIKLTAAAAAVSLPSAVVSQAVNRASTY